ncbi:type II secretion system F family protein [Rubellimicrobium aerolatum]|uniref:Type II secretion system F family protein n=1 Tax=Rubellimicrobium aerolatum TaxID=490979 RepID=A0ABW0SFI9_9RHOB|nr:type II secretion system F family protein [Rubellimicrobium aerolatum]MBP1807135.1 tight adherence protein C [Rubellimicrobium aerolatum]
MPGLAPLQHWLASALGPSGPALALGLLGALLVLVALPALALRPRDGFDRLRGTAAARPPRAEERAERLRRAEGDRLRRFSGLLEPRAAAEHEAIRLWLVQAGYRDRDAVRIFHLAQIALGGGALVLGLALLLARAAALGLPPTAADLVLWALFPGIGGYVLPKTWVARRRAARIDAVARGFPDALDLLLICVEAGQSLDQALQRVAREIGAGAPELAQELGLVTHELRAGKDAPQVLRDMADRCGVPDIASFVTVLIQSRQFGTAVADALRVYAAEMRDKRVLRAEEKANTLPTRMTLATMLLTVPPLLLLLLGPSVHGIAQALGDDEATMEPEE